MTKSEYESYREMVDGKMEEKLQEIIAEVTPEIMEVYKHSVGARKDFLESIKDHPDTPFHIGYRECLVKDALRKKHDGEELIINNYGALAYARNKAIDHHYKLPSWKANHMAMISMAFCSTAIFIANAIALSRGGNAVLGIGSIMTLICAWLIIRYLISRGTAEAVIREGGFIDALLAASDATDFYKYDLVRSLGTYETSHICVSLLSFENDLIKLQFRATDAYKGHFMKATEYARDIEAITSLLARLHQYTGNTMHVCLDWISPEIRSDVKLEDIEKDPLMNENEIVPVKDQENNGSDEPAEV